MAIGLDGTESEMAEFVADNQVDNLTQVWVDTDGGIAYDFIEIHEVVSVPTFVVVNEDGEVVDRFAGWSESKLTGAVEALG